MDSARNLKREVATTVCLLLILGTVAAEVPSYLRQYQSHSFNDLDLFLTQVRKGVQFFKMDISAASYESCSTQSQWHEQLSDCSYDFKYTLPICCLAFRGDTSDRPIFTQPFNTSTELVELFADPKNAQLFTKYSPEAFHNNTIYIFFDIQNDMNSTSNLFINFFYALFKTINDLKLNVRIGTSSTGQFLRINNRCFLDHNCTEKELYISYYPIIFQSSYFLGDDPFQEELGFNRYQNFNIDLEDLEQHCSSGFPAWTQNLTLPYLIWEPSFEYSQQYALNLLRENCPELPASKRDTGGVLITSNMFPEMFEVFSQEIVATEDQERLNLNSDNKKFFAKTFNPHLEYLNEGKCLVAVVQYEGNSTGIRVYDVRTQVLQQEIQIFEIVLQTSSIKSDFLLLRTEERTVIFKRQSEYSCYLIVQEEYEAQPEWLSQSLIELSEQGIFVATLASQQQKAPVLTINRISPEFELYCAQELSELVDLKFESVTLASAVDSALVVYSPQVLDVQAPKYVYTLPLELLGGNAATRGQCTFKTPQKDQPASPPVAYGSAVRAKMYTWQEKTYALISFENTACQSGVFLNNDGTNKCDLTLTESASLLNTDYMLGYAFAQFSEFVTAYQQDSGKLPAGACSQSIAQAKYYLGKKANLALKIDQSQKDQTTIFKAVALQQTVNLQHQTLDSTLFCGCTVPSYPADHGTLLYQFSLTEF